MNPSPSDEEITASFPTSLLSWNREHNHRSMPWKGEKNPYKIWLSEVILQQTRVEQGLSYYEKFAKAYPTVTDLASAHDEDVYALWEGLGYYSRCRNLLAAARFIAFEKGGSFPNSYEEILELKGVGPYTAAAIASFAFGLPYAVLDGNVARVLSRIYLIEQPIDSTEGRKILANQSQELIPVQDAGPYNQAIMDFGATICKPLPLCPSCFFNDKCRARLAGKERELPLKLPKKPSKERWFNYIVLKYGDEILIRQRKASDIWQNLHEFFLVETNGATRPEIILSSLSDDEINVIGITSIRQKLSHQTIHFQFILAILPRKKDFSGYEWKKRAELEGLAFPQTLKAYLRSEPTGAKFDYD